jgi:23S rRNA pseudouridine2605 synthase
VSQPMNLVVYLARAGLGSRRSCDELIRNGSVTVNGEVVTFPREKLALEDVVLVDGEPVEARELRYFLVNKPRGVASTRRDPHAERVIVDLVPNGRILFPVGRLDVDTTGLIILTNDGVLANRLMHPRYGVPKTYVARVRGKVSRRALGTLRQGVDLEDGLTAPAEVNLKKQSAKTALVEITIHEGRKRQVRRMCAAVGLPVEELHRRRYGPIGDKGLEPGGFRELSGDELEALRRAGEEVAVSVGGEVEGEPVLLAAEAPPAPETLRPTAPVESLEEAVAYQHEPDSSGSGE